MDYRVYLLVDHRVGAAELFRSANDVEAAEVARAMFDACSDVFTGYEVWRGDRRLAGSSHGPAPSAAVTSDSILAAHQRTVLDLEEALFETSRLVASSNRLLQAISVRRAQTR